MRPPVADVPAFRDRVLDGVARRLVRRRKAIAYRGQLFVEAGDGEGERLVVRFVTAAPRPTVILELSEGNRLSLYLRSSFRAKRGKVLVRLEDVRVVDNAARIVAAFEWTVDEAWCVDSQAGHDEGRLAAVAARWSTLVMRAV